MKNDFIATSSVSVHAPVTVVWDALTKPELIKQYMFGTNVVSNWQEGSTIKWQGEWKGKAYEDKGTILQYKPNNTLQYSHYSPLGGQPDVPENYHTVTIKLDEKDGDVMVTLTQDNNPTEAGRKHSEDNWNMMLQGLKKFAEQ